MEIDPNKLQTAIVYLQRIADGNNPINNMPAEEDTVLNDPNVIRCMFYVKEILEEIQRNNCVIGKKRSKDEKAKFPIDVLSKYEYKEDLTISHFMEQINSLIDTAKYKRLVYNPVLKWLIGNGYLQEETIEGKLSKIPTEKGKQIGIRAENRENLNGATYIALVYDKRAQEFIISNISNMI